MTHRKIYDRENHDPLEKQIERAQYSVDKMQDNKEWCQSLLDILKQCRWATVVSKEGIKVDVQRIAHTSTWASFFDVINHINLFDTSIFPTEPEELSANRTLKKLYQKRYENI